MKQKAGLLGIWLIMVTGIAVMVFAAGDDERTLITAPLPENVNSGVKYKRLELLVDGDTIVEAMVSNQDDDKEAFKVRSKYILVQEDGKKVRYNWDQLIKHKAITNAAAYYGYTFPFTNVVEQHKAMERAYWTKTAQLTIETPSATNKIVGNALRDAWVDERCGDDE